MPHRNRKLEDRAKIEPRPNARGEMVRLVPIDSKISVLEATEILNINIEELNNLLDDGTIECENDTQVRKVKLESLMNFKSHLDRDRLNSLTELARLSQESEIA